MKLIYEKSHPGRRAGGPPRPQGLAAVEVPAELRAAIGGFEKDDLEA